MTKSISLNITVAVFAAIAMMFALVPMTALAHGGHWNDDDVTVTNSNSAHVSNTVTASANTGGNNADGGDGSGGGDGGSVSGHGNDRNSTGNGGDGGGGGEGGEIWTGNATAYAGVSNTVNSNKTIINRCGCNGGDGDGDIDVVNSNHAFVGNYVGANADTGDNDADGGDVADCGCGDGGDGGDVSGHDNDGNTTGNGGAAGDAGAGGFVWTLDALASASAVNVINSNLTRIRR